MFPRFLLLSMVLGERSGSTPSFSTVGVCLAASGGGRDLGPGSGGPLVLGSGRAGG